MANIAYFHGSDSSILFRRQPAKLTKICPTIREHKARGKPAKLHGEVFPILFRYRHTGESRNLETATHKSWSGESAISRVPTGMLRG